MNNKDWNNETKIIFKAILEEKNIKYNELVHALNDTMDRRKLITLLS